MQIFLFVNFIIKGVKVKLELVQGGGKQKKEKEINYIRMKRV